MASVPAESVLAASLLVPTGFYELGPILRPIPPYAQDVIARLDRNGGPEGKPVETRPRRFSRNHHRDPQHGVRRSSPKANSRAALHAPSLSLADP